MSRRSHAGTRLRLLGLDLLLSVGIVGIVIASCFQAIPALTTKARLAAVVFALTTQRTDSQEIIAITGDFPVPGDAAPVYTQSTPLLSFDIVPTGPGLLARGTVGQDTRPFAVSFTPALSDDGEASLRWLCGTRRASAGWHAASVPAVLTLPHGASYSICRDDGSEGA